MNSVFSFGLKTGLKERFHYLGVDARAFKAQIQALGFVIPTTGKLKKRIFHLLILANGF